MLVVLDLPAGDVDGIYLAVGYQCLIAVVSLWNLKPLCELLSSTWGSRRHSMKLLSSVLLAGRHKDLGDTTRPDNAPFEAGNTCGVNDLRLWDAHRLSLFSQSSAMARI